MLRFFNYFHEISQVINSLKIPLNDKKRVVRKAATEARLAWVLVGAPGS